MVVAGLLFMFATDTGPDLLVSSAVLAVAATAVWFALKVGRRTARPGPVALRPDPPVAFPDFRVTSLRQAIVAGSEDARLAERLRQRLIDIVDDELLAHGVDRAEEPDVARAVLGADLDRFVSDPESVRSMTPRRIAALVTRIEKI